MEISVRSEVNPEFPWTTDWIFTAPPIVHRKFEEFTNHLCGHLYERYANSCFVMVPAQGEVDEEGGWGWAFTDEKECEAISYDKAAGTITITVDNKPDSEFDRLDPSHPEYFATSPMQWMKVAKVFKTIINSDDLDSLAFDCPF